MPLIFGIALSSFCRDSRAFLGIDIDLITRGRSESDCSDGQPNGELDCAILYCHVYLHIMV